MKKLKGLTNLKVWLIDDEQPCLDELAWLLKEYPDLEIAGADTSPQAALSSVTRHNPDVVFLDINMPRIDGLELALRIQEQNPGVIVIFVTGYPRYALDAFKAHPLDFLLKPIKQKNLDDCVDYLRKHYALLGGAKPTLGQNLALRCFGRFEISCQKEARWETRRVRELLLYLIARNGLPVSRQELLKALFGGRDDKAASQNLYMTIYRLKSLLDIIDPSREKIKLTDRNVLVISPGVCDFTDFMNFARANAVITEQNAAEAEQILDLCGSSFLENDIFEWASDIQDELEIHYERIAIGLALCHIFTGQTANAEKTLTAVLKRNTLCEKAYTLLLDIAMKSGSNGKYLALYEQYAQMLEKELDEDPEEQYRRHYEQLNS